MVCVESNHQRISFASDLDQSDKAPHLEQQQPLGLVRRDTSLLDSSNSDFEFHISRNFDPEDSSPADEIFADGMILPVLPFQVTAASAMPKRLYKYELPPIVSTHYSPSSSSSAFPPPPLPQNSRKYSDKETRGSCANSDLEAEKPSTSFWSFKRSSSLNCEIKKSLIRSFPRFTRRSSTGSLTNSKRAMLKDINKHSSLRHDVQCQGANPSSHLLSSSPPPPPSSLCCSTYQFMPQKHTAKNDGGKRGGSLRIASVTGGLFGLGSILRLSKEKKKK